MPKIYSQFTDNIHNFIHNFVRQQHDKARKMQKRALREYCFEIKLISRENRVYRGEKLKELII